MKPTTIRMRMAPLLFVGALASANCFSPKITEGVTCGEGDSCPAGMQCDPVDDRCRFELLPNGNALVISPDAFEFGSVVLGNPSSISTFAVFNSGLVPSTALQVVLDGSNQFKITNDECEGIVLPLQGSCSISGIFEPTEIGAPTGTLRVSDTDNTAVSNLSGTGLEPGDLRIDPPTLDFGTHQVASDTTRVFTLTNSGSRDAQGITIATTSANTSFRIEDDNCTDEILPSLQTCTFSATFTPQQAGDTNTTIEARAIVGVPTTTAIDGLGRSKILVTNQSISNGPVGIVTSNPSGLQCGSVCDVDFTVANVTLIPEGRNNAKFVGWGSPDSCDQNTLCDLQMNVAATDATARWRLCIQDEFLRCENPKTKVLCGDKLDEETFVDCGIGICDPEQEICTECTPGETVCLSDGGSFMECGDDGFFDGNIAGFCPEGTMCVGGACTIDGAPAG